jgi:hypothetical protein
MHKAEADSRSRREKYFRPVHPLRPREFYSYRPQRAWYQSIYAYLIPVMVLAFLAVYYYAL